MNSLIRLDGVLLERCNGCEAARVSAPRLRKFGDQRDAIRAFMALEWPSQTEQKCTAACGKCFFFFPKSCGCGGVSEMKAKGLGA